MYVAECVRGCERSKDWRCRKRGTQATRAHQGDLTGVIPARQRQSFSRTLLSQKPETVHPPRHPLPLSLGSGGWSQALYVLVHEYQHVCGCAVIRLYARYSSRTPYIHAFL
jgi:hypothetical protein